MNDGSGQSSQESFAYFDRDTWQLKTYQGCLFEGVSTYSETLPSAGTMRNGRLYRRQMSEHPISENASGLLGTPTATMKLRSERFRKGRSPNPAEAARWPTPTGRDHKDGTAESCKNVPVNSLLGRAVHWPTPKTPTGGGQMERTTKGGGIRKLEDAVSKDVGYNTGSLNPTFVEYLMGFPKDWTVE